MDFLKELKIAVINKDIKRIEKLADMSVSFNSLEEAEEINAYLKKAVELLKEEKTKLSSEMKKIKNLQKFTQDRKKETFSFKG